MLVVGFSMQPRLPGLPFQHPQREPLRQIVEDYGLSQGPHWEHREGLSSSGEMTSTHPLRRITAGAARCKPGEGGTVGSSSSLDFACRRSINSAIPAAGPQTEWCCRERSDSALRGSFPLAFPGGRGKSEWSLTGVAEFPFSRIFSGKVTWSEKDCGPFFFLQLLKFALFSIFTDEILTTRKAAKTILTLKMYVQNKKTIDKDKENHPLWPTHKTTWPTPKNWII